VGQLSDFSRIDPDVLKAKQELGKNVHLAIEAHNQGLFAPLTKRERPYFDSWQRWHETTQMTPHQEELRLYDDQLRITGCFDAVYRAGSSLILVDYKCTAAPSDSWEYQGAFYWHLARINGIELDPRYLFLQLLPTGKIASCYSFKRSETVWQECLQLYRRYIAEHGFPEASPQVIEA
jgi:hypothetical protein